MNTFLQHHLLEKIHHLHPLFLLPFFASLLFLYRCLNTNHQKNQPPSPPRLPILGNLHQLTKHPHRSLHLLSQKYGDLMLLQLGNKPILVVSSANGAREIMKTHDIIFSNRPKSTASRQLLYNAKDVVFSNYGEYWRQMKSIFVIQLLSTVRVRSSRTMREEETSLMLEKITRCIPSLVNLSDIIVTLTNDMVCREAFGKKYKDGNFQVMLNKFLKLLGTFSLGDFIPWLSWIDRVNGWSKEVGQVVKEFDAFLERIIQEHQDINNNTSDQIEKAKDFVDVLLEVQTDSTIGVPFDRDGIKAQLLIAFAGGTETTFASIEWAMSELLRHPKALKELQEEIRSIGHGKAMVNEHDIEGMKYLKAVIKETLRLHPPAPLLVFHESSQEVKINGYDIAEKTQVIINAWAIHRDPSFWEDPDKFLPERFLNSKVDFKGQDFQFIPFGSGRRICPGITFAITGIELVLANLIYAFDWALPGGAQGETLDMDESEGASVHRHHPLLLVATPSFKLSK